MKNFIEDVKNDLVPIMKGTLKAGQYILSNLLNRIDSDLTKMINVLKEKQQNLKQYLIDRDELLKQIEGKHQEAERLKEQINKVKREADSQQLGQLRKELNMKLDELIGSQKKYFDLEEKIKKEENKTKQLLQDKLSIENDRNKIKSKYDKLQKILKENREKTTQLESQIHELKQKETHLQEQIKKAESKAQVEELKKSLRDLQGIYNQKIKEQNGLEKEIEEYQREFKELEKQLIQKVTELSKISKELHSVNMALSKSEEEKKNLKTSLETNEKSLKKSTEQMNKLEQEVSRLQYLEGEYEKKYSLAMKEVKVIEDQLAASQETAINEMAAYEEQIESLQREIIDKQNEVAMTRAENGEAQELSIEEREIMEREFEPRFKVLYKGCKFYPEFYSDFFRVTPSDRLKIEAAIVQLNYNFELTMTNVRPKPIKTKTNTILEFPFGSDAAGRIYFQKQNHIIHLYRISRTKNGKGRLTQNNVIEWIKVNM
ncbi:hypothetical protein V1502_18730 [Bacillus sp. SCS-153A]|uniref:hypothetical protein n=1 Tax=Rossellomorea sedimentorum TaxID=3115294 RepID=UPI003905AE78